MEVIPPPQQVFAAARTLRAQLGRVGRTSAGRQDELSDRRLAADPNGRAHVLCWKVVKHATKPNSLSRSRLWVAAGACALTAPASSQAVEQSWERPGVLARSLRHFCCVLAAPHSSYIPRHCSLKAHVSQRQEDEAESATPAKVSELIGARASSTHRGRVRGLS